MKNNTEKNIKNKKLFIRHPGQDAELTSKTFEEIYNAIQGAPGSNDDSTDEKWWDAEYQFENEGYYRFSECDVQVFKS